MKLALKRGITLANLSPPVRGRGLKRDEINEIEDDHVVAPRAGAWIETREKEAHSQPFLVAPRAGAWIETHSKKSAQSNKCCRPPCGGVD